MSKISRILISTDDGIHAPGLKSLEKIAAVLSDDVWVVAPETEQSGASHSLTLHEPLRLREVGHQKYAVTGTPSDCVMMALKHVIPGAKPDLVLSGVNRGSNMAEDVTYSGTVAAAMEGTALGIPSIAMSQVYQFKKNTDVKWACVEAHAPSLIKRLVELGWPKDVLININFPDVAPRDVEGVDITVQGLRDQSEVEIDARVDVRGNDYFWLALRRGLGTAEDGTDLHAIYGSRISVTPLHMNLTHREESERLSKSLGEFDISQA